MSDKPLPKLSLVKKAIGLALIAIFLFDANASAQCGFAAGLGCPSTDYSNYGFNSTPNAATIEYDNFISGFHATVVRNSDGKFQIWGENSASNGNSPLLSPTEINSTNFNGLTGTPIRMAIGSEAANHQFILLTTDGLFVWGDRGTVISTSIRNSASFGKITVGGKSDGLPAGVSPAEVKMMFAGPRVLAIVTCDGDAYVLTNGKTQLQGDGLSAHPTTWSRVKIDDKKNGNPYLTGVIALRGSYQTLMALTNTNEVYTWGNNTLSGIESSYSPVGRSLATKMTLPSTSPIKMIGVTYYDGNFGSYAMKRNPGPSYYVLYSDGNLYAMGNNELRQLGNFTTTNTPVSKGNAWVQPRYPQASNANAAGAVMDDVKWISPNEHDLRWGAINIINNDGRLWNWGSNAGSMLGRTAVGQDKNDYDPTFNPGQPLANEAFDPATSKVMTVETGGHTTMIIQECEETFGYVGHAIDGSTAAGIPGDLYYPKFIFSTATIQVCGTQAHPEISFATAPVTGGNANVLCKNQILELVGTPAGGVFQVMSGPGILNNDDLLTFTGGDAAGTVKVRYTVSTSTCTNDFIERDIVFEACVIYKIRGTLWVDNNANAIKDPGELGNNGAIAGAPGLWANLVDAGNKVIASVKVAADGSYELSALQNGTYSVRITNGQIGIGATIPASSNTLPAGWQYTGNNRSNSSVCVAPGCVNPNIISGVVINSADIAGLNFGILGNYTISGTIFHDANGLNDAIPAVNGIPVYTAGSGYTKPAQPQLYVAVVGTDNKVSDYATVAANGTYSITVPASNVVFVLTSSNPVKGNPPVQAIPSGWAFVGEEFGTGNGSGTGVNNGSGSGANAPATREDGKINVSFSGSNTVITNVNFGIEHLPVADAKTYIGVPNGEFNMPEAGGIPGFPDVNSYQNIRVTNPFLGPLTGSDLEDCPTPLSCAAGKTFRIRSIGAHTKLYYDFGGATGVKEITVPPGGYVSLSNFDPSKLVIYGEVGYGSAGSEFRFGYSLVDAAGKEGAPADYVLSTFAILPVVITNFNATLKGTGVELTWATASEDNNKGFVIEKGNDSYTWSVLAEVPSASPNGHSSKKLSYKLTDSQTLVTTTYYRLKQIDKDGTPHIYAIRSIKVRDLPITIFPNPASSKVTIGGLNGVSTIQLFDFNGRKMRSETATADNIVMDITDFPIGIYNVIVSDDKGNVNTQKLSKK